jgi:hypothetical protein
MSMSMSTQDILLHLANTESYQEEVIEMLAYYRDRYDFSNALREFVYSEAFAGDLSALQHELMMTALSHVSWAEVADDYYNEYHGVESA